MRAELAQRELGETNRTPSLRCCSFAMLVAAVSAVGEQRELQRWPVPANGIFCTSKWNLYSFRKKETQCVVLHLAQNSYAIHSHHVPSARGLVSRGMTLEGASDSRLAPIGRYLLVRHAARSSSTHLLATLLMPTPTHCTNNSRHIAYTLTGHLAG